MYLAENLIENSNNENIRHENKSSIYDKKLRIKIPVIPYTQ